MNTGRSARLDTIINVRDHQQRQTTKELSQIQRQKKQETDRLQDMHGTHHQAMKDSFSRQRVTASDVQNNSAFLQRLAGEIRQQTGTIEKIEGMETEKRGELLERVKAKNVIEKLQEKVKTEIQKEIDAKEQQMLDMLGQRSTEQSL